jgi:hypothetical protein
VGDFLYLCIMKDLSEYIESILEVLPIEADYKVWYEEGTYLIKIRVKGLTYVDDITQKHLRLVINNLLDKYFPKGSIKYAINLLYYVA